MSLDTLTIASWLLLAVAALLIGFSKTAIAGVAMISIGIAAAVVPAKQSTGLMLLLLLVGDVYAVTSYHRHADWAVLRRLAPAVVVGILIGVVFVARVDDVVMRRTIGWILLFMIGFHLVTKWRARHRAVDHEQAAPSKVVTVGAGTMAGFTTMAANAGGAVMTLYMLRTGMTMMTFLGTGAWFYLLVNTFKLPFSIGLGLISPASVVVALVMVPLVLIGCWVGRRVVGHLKPAHFEVLVLVFTALAAANLVR